MPDAQGWLALVLAYLLGSIPNAYLAGRLLKGIDLRQTGSGNLGATNVYRSLGAPAAVMVLLADAAKGAIPTLYFRDWIGGPSGVWWPAALGMAAIIGHVRPLFGLFNGGGKGVATASGVFAALSPAAYGVAVLVFVATVGATRFVSLGSMLGGLALAVASAVLYGPGSYLTLLSALIAMFLIYTHRANIGRLRRGEETRLSRSVGRS
ncbi:MAG: glycerol-3-phosphate 1-O-acyltransferase PlsY [Gemmatimonadaceae bacterium]